VISVCCRRCMSRPGLTVRCSPH